MAGAAPSLVWFRQDLRLSDNPALAAALELGAPVIPVFIWDPTYEGDWPPGAGSKWWLGRSLEKLSLDLSSRGSRLVICRGPSVTALSRLSAETGAAALFFNRRWEPAVAERDGALSQELTRRGLRVESFNGNLLFEPGSILSQGGRPFQVFTAFWRACISKVPTGPSPEEPKHLPAPEAWPHSLDLSTLGLEPETEAARNLEAVWRPGESAARRRLKNFLRNGIGSYAGNRNLPAVEGTSRLSPHLHFGEISPGDIWRNALSGMEDNTTACQAFLRQLLWREFAYHLMHHYPESPHRALRSQFDAFPWRDNANWLDAWKSGRTGYPLVDAGMRELESTGWMHNRARMIAASFLVKHLLIGWQDGAAWFWDSLVDADLAINTLNWQWVAGCGTDAAPYFRIFNPIVQQTRFDPDGAYIRRWIPELGSKHYPSPMVEHRAARQAALDAFDAIRNR